MKVIKISIAVLAVAAIGVFVWLGIKPTKCEKCNKPLTECVCLIDIDSDNPFVKNIAQKIDELQSKPVNKFCKKDYDEIKFDIAEKNKKSQFGSGKEGEKWHQSLSVNLFRVYAAKFIDQAFYVFQNNEWKKEDLEIIDIETARLQTDTNHSADDAFEPKFKEIRQIYNKYMEVVKFIMNANSLPHYGTGLSDHFPVAEVQRKMSEAKTLRDNHLGNEYVNNCTRLHDRLKEIPQNLFNAHVKYLDDKIDKFVKKYSDPEYNFTSQAEYARILNKPIQDEIEVINNGVYANFINSEDIESKYDYLSNAWAFDNRNANDYFRKR